MNVKELKEMLKGLDDEAFIFLNVMLGGDNQVAIASFVQDLSYEGPDDLGFSYLLLKGEITKSDLADAAVDAGLMELPD